jgi:hypothetical protein
MLVRHCATVWIARRLAFRFMPKTNSAAINLGLPHNTHELKHGQVGRSQPTRERVSPCSIAPNIGITIERQVREADESLYPSRDCRLRRRPKLGDGIVGREEGF